MARIEVRLGDEDIKEFAPEGAPEWVPFDRDGLDDLAYDEMRPWEKEIRATDEDASIQKLIYQEWADGTALGIKGAVWLAWKMAGIETPAWRDFNIKTNKVRWSQEDDADPPGVGSMEPSAEHSTTAPSTDSSPP